MSSKHLATYLNDHLAGSVVAVELLTYLASSFPGTNAANTSSAVLVEVNEDRSVLEGLMARLQISQSGPRKTSAWLSEKLTQLKLRFDDLTEGSLRRLEASEAVSLGIEGKRSLWLALAAASGEVPGLAHLDYAQLIQRAEAQRGRMESVRLAAARESLA